MSKVFINAGHSLLDPGAFYNPYRENELSIELKDKVVALFKEAGVEIGGVVPDNLYLKQSIAWVNERVDMNDIAFSIHFNAHKFRNISGTEDYYSNDREKHMAEIFSRTVSKSIGIPNRGAKPDTESWVGSLGWLRQLKCDSVLVEVCFLTSFFDMNRYNADSVAQGFLEAINEILVRKEPREADRIGRVPDLQYLQLKLSLLQRLVVVLQKLLELLKKI